MSGGYSIVKKAHQPSRIRITKEEQNERALSKVKKRLGEDKCQELISEFKKAPDQEQHGMILTVLSQGLTQSGVRALFSIGGSRASRIYALLGQERPVLTTYTPKHAATDADKEAIRRSLDSYDIEPGYPCAHRKPLEYFADNTLDWTKIYKKYAKERTLKQQRVRFRLS